MPLLNSLVFLPKFSGPSALLAFSMVLFTVCTHDSFSSRLLMGAHIRKTSLKCQSSDISTGKFRISGISSQDHGCTRRENRLFSPTPMEYRCISVLQSSKLAGSKRGDGSLDSFKRHRKDRPTNVSRSSRKSYYTVLLLHNSIPAPAIRIAPRIVKSPVPGPPVLGRAVPGVFVTVIL